ncbi:MAG: hypothetical protein Q7R79_01925 [bacterium]|nr:hypothetical protein [bacterium]
MRPEVKEENLMKGKKQEQEPTLGDLFGALFAEVAEVVQPLVQAFGEAVQEAIQDVEEALEIIQVQPDVNEESKLSRNLKKRARQKRALVRKTVRASRTSAEQLKVLDRRRENAKREPAEKERCRLEKQISANRVAEENRQAVQTRKAGATTQQQANIIAKAAEKSAVKTKKLLGDCKAVAGHIRQEDSQTAKKREAKKPGKSDTKKGAK